MCELSTYYYVKRSSRDWHFIIVFSIYRFRLTFHYQIYITIFNNNNIYVS